MCLMTHFHLTLPPHFFPSMLPPARTDDVLQAVLFSFICIQGVLLIGEINVIAPMVSMMYLMTYGVINFACFLLTVTGAPNFRPRFKYFSWHTALAGAGACLAVMFIAQPTYAAVAIFLMVGLFLLVASAHVVCMM